MQVGTLGNMSANATSGEEKTSSSADFNAALQASGGWRGFETPSTPLFGEPHRWPGASQGGDEKMGQLLKQVISLLQSSGGGSSNGAADISKLISVLNHELTSGKLDPQRTAMAEKLLPMLEQKLVSMEQSGGQSGDGITKLMGQLISDLGKTSSASGAEFRIGTVENKPVDKSSDGTTSKGSKKYDEADGIPPAEINAMLKSANGTGPEVNLNKY